MAVELVRNLVAHGDAREGKCRGNWRMEWVASTLTPSPNVVITQADAHTSAASSRLNWRPHRLKWTCPFRGKTKSGFCACAITFRTSYTAVYSCSVVNSHATMISESRGGKTPHIPCTSVYSYSVVNSHATMISESHGGRTPHTVFGALDSETNGQYHD